MEPWLNPLPDIAPMDTYFNDGHHTDITVYLLLRTLWDQWGSDDSFLILIPFQHFHPHVSLDSIHVDFGSCTDLKNIEPITVRLTNHTQGKIIAQWMGHESHTFYVSPNSMEIPALKTADFRIHFNAVSRMSLVCSLPLIEEKVLIVFTVWYEFSIVWD